MEIIGTIVFALQGSLVGIERKLDILGIMILGLSTAVGGGMIRDVILGNTPPAMFINPIYCIVASITVMTVIFTYKYHYRIIGNNKYPYILGTIHFLDALGLGIFTIVGTNISIQSGFEKNMFLCVFVGVVTGVGGGVLRDIIANRTPVVLEREIYAVASMIGAMMYYYLNRWILNDIALYMALGIIVIVRMICVYRNIHLPAIEGEKQVGLQE